MTRRWQRGATPPYQAVRHPRTGALLRVHENVDPELLVMQIRIGAGETGGVLDNMERVKELAKQSQQNRRRIARKCLGALSEVAGTAVVVP